MLGAGTDLRKLHFNARLAAFLVVHLCWNKFPILKWCGLARLKWTCASGNCARTGYESSSQASRSRFWPFYWSVPARPSYPRAVTAATVPSDTYVDFDHGLNAAINRVRESLGDSV